MKEVRQAGEAAGLKINVGKTNTVETVNKNSTEQTNRGGSHQ